MMYLGDDCVHECSDGGAFWSGFVVLCMPSPNDGLVMCVCVSIC